MSPRQREEHLRGPQGERAPQGQCACGPGRRRASDNKPSRCRNFDTDSEDPETPRELSGKGSERIRPTLLRMMLSLVWRIDGGGGRGGSWEASDGAKASSSATGQWARRARRW